MNKSVFLWVVAADLFAGTLNLAILLRVDSWTRWLNGGVAVVCFVAAGVMLECFLDARRDERYGAGRRLRA